MAQFLKGYYPSTGADIDQPSAAVHDEQVLNTSPSYSTEVPGIKRGMPNPRHAEIERMVRLYNRDPDVQRAVTLFSDMFAGVPYKVVHRTKKQEETLSDLDYPLNDLNKGNYLQSGVLLRKKLALWYSLCRVAYLCMTPDPMGKGVQFHVLDPRHVWRIPDKDKGVGGYVYWDSILQDASPIIYPAEAVIELTVDGFGDEPYALTLPASTIHIDSALGKSSREGLARKSQQQGEQVGVIYTDNADQMRSRMKKNSRGSKFLFLDKEEKIESMSLVSKDGVEADLVARGEAIKAIYSAMSTPSALRDPAPETAEQLRNVIAAWLRLDVLPLATLFAAQVTHRLCVGPKINRELQVAQGRILELAPLYVEATRSTVAHLNAGDSTIAEQRTDAGRDTLKLPEEVAEFTWVLDTPKPVLEAYKAKMQLANKPGPDGSPMGAAGNTTDMPGTMGGRQQRTEGQMIDETGKK